MSQKWYQLSQNIRYFKIKLAKKPDLIEKNGFYFYSALQNGPHSVEKT